jgi:trehalose/maltose hydrolase-like predicted phosphorylase
MADPHLAAIEWELTPENWSGQIEIRSALDGSVSNQGVERYRDLNSQHLRPLASGRAGEDGIYLAVESTQSQIQMVQAARTHLFRNGERAVLERETSAGQDVVEQRLITTCEQGKPIRVVKTVALFTDRDFAISHPQLAACDAIDRAASFDDLLQSHAQAWSHLWNRADIEIGDSDAWSQLVLRLHIFHLLQSVSLNSIDLDIGVPARGWHGEAYRGHIFWDELFIFPFLNLRVPELTQSLLMYRYRRLPEARHLAKIAGYCGAMFPWQSGSNGREESQVLHLNPKSGRWVPDNSHRQRHINAAIAYNVWQYFQATDDMEFLSNYGVELLLEIARFWASIAAYNADRDRYEICNVMGPDEFHTQYPDVSQGVNRNEPSDAETDVEAAEVDSSHRASLRLKPESSQRQATGNGDEARALNNNAYTNVMASWVIRIAVRAFDMLADDQRRELVERLGLSDEEFQRFDQVSRKLFVPFHDDHIISQFEGYEHLEEFDWEGYRKKYDDIQRLDRILEAENDTPNRYKASKQADVLMLFYLFSAEELTDIFAHLGYSFDPEIIPKNIDYYIARTSHGSTLSRVVHSWVLARRERGRAWELFQGALKSDVADIQGGTTPEGIHLGAMAGTVDVIARCHTGIEMRDEVLWFNPCLPKDVSLIRQRVRYRGHWLRLNITHEHLTVCFERGPSSPAKIGIGEEVYTFCQGDRRKFALKSQ